MYRGKAIQLLTETKDSFQLNVDALQSVLGDNRIKNKHIVLISIAGEMRGGKSFMQDFFLRYLQSEKKESWLLKEDEPLSGFTWKNGDDKDTTGILLWSEPHIVKSRSGEEYAVLLMDTQGTFDKKSSVKKNAMVFALSTMVSSIQIFNVRQQILEDKLQFLRLFTSYGRLAMTHSDDKDKPFQHLHFLVRDWPCPYKNSYGLVGGESYLQKVLHVDGSTHSEVIEVRQFIEQCFSRIDCCLMPNPGMKVMSCESFDGRISDIEPAFVEILSTYVPRILSPEYMLPKAINGSKVTCLELLEYFKAYFKVFDSNDMPQPIDLYKATTEANNMALLSTCNRLYVEEMDKICTPHSRYLPESRLQKEHSAIKKLMITKYETAKKFGDRPQIEEYHRRLETEIEEAFVGFVERNINKKKYEREGWSLVVLLVWYVVGLVTKNVFLLVGMDTASSVMDAALYVLLLMALLWLGTFVGGKTDLKMYLDDGLSHSWNYVLRPSFLKLRGRFMTLAVKNSLESQHSATGTRL